MYQKAFLAAGLRSDPLGQLYIKRSPDPLAAIWGPTSTGMGRGGNWIEAGEGEKREPSYFFVKVYARANPPLIPPIAVL